MMNEVKEQFASKFQKLLIILLVISFFLIGQEYSMLLYKIGICLLIITTLIQIPFGNIHPQTSFKKSMKSFAKIFLIIIIIFAIGIMLAPYLINMGRS